MKDLQICRANSYMPRKKWRNFHETIKALLAAKNWRCELANEGEATSPVTLKKSLAPDDGDGSLAVLCQRCLVFKSQARFPPIAALHNPVQLSG